MIVAPHNNCAACSKRIIAHKVKLKCWTCSQYYHTGCANLTPNEVLKLDCSNLYKYWTCFTCTKEIFPFIHSDNQIEKNKVNHNANSNIQYNDNTCSYTRVNCNTCEELADTFGRPRFTKKSHKYV